MVGGVALAMALVAITPEPGSGSDHLDSPTVIADPAADIGDLYAWMAPDGKRLNLVMDIVARRFSDRLQYVFHVESGKQYGATTAAMMIVCRFDAKGSVECFAGEADHVRGNGSTTAGLESTTRRMRVFAGLRDDPFFNNVTGTRAMYALAGAAIRRGARTDASGCPRFDRATSRSIRATWRQTDGGPAMNFLAGWPSSSLVISIDLAVVATGGRYLAVWSAVHRAPDAQQAETSPPVLGAQIERTARPLIKNALVGAPLASADESNTRKEAYNRAARGDWGRFADDIESTLGMYDGLDGTCGNQWLTDRRATGATRYKRLATLLADDRIWVNSGSAVCREFLAVERGLSGDCGGRTPTYDASNIFRSLLCNGATRGVDDGLRRDEQEHSPTTFPFLAAPVGPLAVDTATSSIAIANLDQRIAQLHDDGAVVDVLLLRSRFLADYDALDRASALTEGRFATRRDLLARARVRAAVHRFAEASADVDRAERTWGATEETAGLRASILVATGRAAEAVALLQANLRDHPGFASQSALATAYAALGRREDADHLYAQALRDLDATLPFPYAWTSFARGLIWGEEGTDRVRAAAMYTQALALVPEFAAAGIHLAEIAVARADTASAIARLERVVRSSGDPEALALLGVLHTRTSDAMRGMREVIQAKMRFEALLARHPLAFAEHAAEFYLGPGADAERAWQLAMMNLANRNTARAVALAIKAATASGRTSEAVALGEGKR